MLQTIDEIEKPFFLLLAGEMPLKEFEQWLYATPAIEDYCGEAIYLELVSFNFRQPAANYEISKIINKFIPLARFDHWQIYRLLKSLLDKSLDPVDSFEKIYYLYGKGYFFLHDIGLEYIYGPNDISRLPQRGHWSEKELLRRKILLDDSVELIKGQIELILQALDTGDIQVNGEGNYSIVPGLARELENIVISAELERNLKSVRRKKPWWKIW